MSFLNFVKIYFNLWKEEWKRDEGMEKFALTERLLCLRC